jgi:hypothetical protein
MDFQDRGLPEMISTRQFPGHEHQTSQGSYSSMAILMGRVSHKRDGSEVIANPSNPFTDRAISRPMPQESTYLAAAAAAGPTRDEKGVSFTEEKESQAPKPRPSKSGRNGSTRRSSGWNTYWSGGSGMTILGFGASKRTTYGSDHSDDSQSEYSESRRLPSQVTQKSALVPPLKLGERPFELNRVMSGSPTIAYPNSQFPMSKEMSGHIERSGSVSSLSSYNEDRRDAFSSGIPESINEQNSWTPVDGQGWNRNVAPSNYSESVYAPTIARDTANFPMPQRETRFPGQPLYPPQASAKYQTQTSQHASDMSWLNLGGNSRI